MSVKLLQERLPQQVDAALASHVGPAVGWATMVRFWFAVTSLLAAVGTWNHASNARMIYLALAIVWQLMAVTVSALTKRGATESLISATTLLDITIVHLGLIVFVQQGLFPKLGA